MRAIIIDDEAANRENLVHLLSVASPDVEPIALCGAVDESIAAIKTQQPELVFLDIQLHDQSGFDLLSQVKEINFEVIFITAYDKYGIQAVKFAALDYLLKPIDVNELKAAVAKARIKISEKDKNKRLQYLADFLTKDERMPLRIALPMFNEIRYVPVQEIMRCEADNTYTYFYLVGGERLLISKTLKEYAELLAPYGFLRSHQSHLVNAKFIKSWLKQDGGMLLLNNQVKVPVSKLNRERVKSALTGLI